VYNETVMRHFLKPKFAGELKGADAVGTVGNPICGDKMSVCIKVKAGKISAIRFKTFGCAAAIATSDMVCGLALGKTLDAALKITRNDVSEALGKLPPIKEHCSNLAADALGEAIFNYYSARGEKIPKALAERRAHLACASCEAHQCAPKA